MVYEVKLHNPTLSTFEVSVVQRAIKLIMEKNWALSVDQCWLQAFQFLVHLINFVYMSKKVLYLCFQNFYF